MKLSALMDYPDDARHVFYESTMYEMMKQLSEMGASRVYLQYYGDSSYGYFWNHKAPTHREMVQSARNLPNYSKVFSKAARKYGMESVVVMRPQEQGIWHTFSPYYEEVRKYGGIPHTGGDMMITSNFLRKNPELRIKRRTYDIDSDARSRTIGAIKLFKHNNIHTRITKANISIYTSKDNSYYRKYEGEISLEYDTEKAKKDSVEAGFSADYPEKVLTKTGDAIEVIMIRELKKG